MTNQASITLQNERLLVSGDINFETAVSLWSDSLPLLTQDKLTFDFSGVSSSNSAGLALLLEWVKYAKQNNKVIQLENLPAQIVSIAGVAGVDGIFPAQ